MMDWISLTLVFVFGIAIGILVSSLFFESRLRFYKEYIERRLASINLPRFQSAAKSKSPKRQDRKTDFSHTSKREKDSESPQN